MTNPGNIVRVRARNGGRASVYEANGWAQAYTEGILDGVGVQQNTPADMNVMVGGSNTKPEVILAKNPTGYRIALDLVGLQAIAITAPATNSRISAIVVYTDDLSLATTEDTITGSPSSCGLIVVNGTPAANPVEPTDADIRTAITADGATGSQAAYCVIATILVANDTTTIDNSLITNKRTSFNSSNSGLLDFFYPVGSYYETSNTTFDPNVSWGGTWVEDTAGKVTVSYDNGDTDFGTVSGTGGAKTGLTLIHLRKNNVGLSEASLSYTDRILVSNTQTTSTTTNYNEYASTIQPYIVVKRWHRTA